MSDLGLNKITENELTRQLTRYQIQTYPYDRTLNLKNNMMLGSSRKHVPGSNYYQEELVSIVWIDAFTDLKVTPLVSEYKDDMYLDEMVFSPDGKWIFWKVKTEKMTKEKYPRNIYRLLIFKADPGSANGIGNEYTGGLYSDFEAEFMFNSNKDFCYVLREGERYCTGKQGEIRCVRRRGRIFMRSDRQIQKYGSN